MFCNYCGKSVPDHSPFCNGCGKALKKTTPKVPLRRAIPVIPKYPQLPAVIRSARDGPAVLFVTVFGYIVASICLIWLLFGAFSVGLLGGYQVGVDDSCERLDPDHPDYDLDRDDLECDPADTAPGGFGYLWALCIIPFWGLIAGLTMGMIG